MRRLTFAIAFWAYFVITSLVFFTVVAVLWVITTPFDRDRRVLHLFGCFWASQYASVYPGWRVRHTGRQHIKRRTPYVLVANHTSLADIVLLYGLYRQFKWMSKKSVFSYPLIGWNMTLCRYIPLVRGDKDSIAAALRSCHYWLGRGISIAMFPEGTRSPDGQLKAFKHGAFTMALEAGVDVLPIAIHGGYDVIPKHGRSFAGRADMWVEVLEPEPHERYADSLSYAAAVRKRIAVALGQEESAAISERPIAEVEPRAIVGSPSLAQ